MGVESDHHILQDPIQETAAIATCPEMSGCQPKHHCVPAYLVTVRRKHSKKKNDGGNLGQFTINP